MMNKVPKMKRTASVWAPLIYKRLLAADKRDRDIAERCLKDLEPMLLPTHSSLAKVLYETHALILFRNVFAIQIPHRRGLQPSLFNENNILCPFE